MRDDRPSGAPEDARTRKHVAFLMEQGAGHLTNYRNLRTATEHKPDLAFDPHWHELRYYVPGGRIEALRENYLRFLPGYVTGNLRMAGQFRSALAARRYDAVFTNSWAAMMFTRRLRNLPTAIDFDSTPRQIDRMPAYGSPADPPGIGELKYRVYRHSLHAARLLQAWSNWARDSAIRDYGVPAERVVVNPPGVNLDLLHPAGRTGGSPIRRVLFVGGDFKRKGGDLLLHWFDHSAGDDVELHLVTREPVHPRPRMTLYPDIAPNSTQLVGLYQSADVFVLPSLGECFGMATIEAMASGLPVITSDVGGTADIVAPGENGFIVPAGNNRALGEALDSVLADEARRAAMGRRSRELAEARFDAYRNAMRTMDLLKAMIEE